MSTTSKWSVLVVGAGIAGATIAGLLVKSGHEVLLLENNKLFISGMGLCLPANAVECLKQLGIFHTVIEQSFQSKRWIINENNGEQIAQIDLESYFGKERVFIATHRKILQQALLNLSNIEVQSELAIENIEANQDKYLSVRFNNGEVRKFDLLVAADGIYSTIRQMIMPEIKIHYLGVGCYRWLIEKPKSLSHTQFIMGDGSFLLLHPLNEKSMYCGLVFSQAYQKKLTDSKFLQLMHNFTLPNEIILPQDKSSILPGWMETVSAPIFSQGRVVFIGDAGHGCATSLQQGAALAMEDAMILSSLLNKETSIATVLHSFSAIRQNRIAWVMHESNRCMDGFTRELAPAEKILRNKKIMSEGLGNFILWKQLFKRDPFPFH